MVLPEAELRVTGAVAVVEPRRTVDCAPEADTVLMRVLEDPLLLTRLLTVVEPGAALRLTLLEVRVVELEAVEPEVLLEVLPEVRVVDELEAVVDEPEVLPDAVGVVAVRVVDEPADVVVEPLEVRVVDEPDVVVVEPAVRVVDEPDVVVLPAVRVDVEVAALRVVVVAVVLVVVAARLSLMSRALVTVLTD